MTRKKLTAIRNHALDEAQKDKSWLPNWTPLPAMGLLTAVVLLVIVYGKPVSLPGLDTNQKDLEMLASIDQLELFENLEFYDWLANESYDEG